MVWAWAIVITTHNLAAELYFQERHENEISYAICEFITAPRQVSDS